MKESEFPESTGGLPAWIGSVAAVKWIEEESTVTVDHAVVVVGADSDHLAEDKAMNMALRQWPLADGWLAHGAVVTQLEPALKQLSGHDGIPARFGQDKK